MADPPVTQIAVIADIHGNLPALEAVAADIRLRGIERVLNLGDHASGPLWPAGTVDFLMAQPWTHISGNCDRMVATGSAHLLGASDRFACERLATRQRSWLAQLPKTLSITPGILMTHGRLADDERYLLETVEGGGARLATKAEVRERLGAVSETVVLCAHSHIPRIVSGDGSRLIVNPGSVGMPAYEHDLPAPHKMESGSPHARYAVLTRTGARWQVQLIALDYDHGAAARKAREEGRLDWEQWQLTGQA